MDRRTVWAILLMMVIAIAPAIFMKKTVAPSVRGGEAGQRDSTSVQSDGPSSGTVRQDSTPPVAAQDTGRTATTDSLTRLPAAQGATDTVLITSPLYTYGVSTRGGRLVEATLHRYGSMAPGSQGQDRKSTRLNSSHANISYAVFCLKKKNEKSNLHRSVHDEVNHNHNT